MTMRAVIAGILGMAALGGCTEGGRPEASVPPAQAGETISISVGPCFGFCPVYTASIEPDGTVVFNGERHTALLGEKQRKLTPATYRDVARELAPFCPATGASESVACDSTISDTSTFTISWTAGDGTKTVATLQRGCSGGPGKDLDRVLQTLPQQLKIEAWSKQITRPGVSRG